MTFTLLANALLLGLFWSLVLKPVFQNSKSLNQQDGVYQVLKGGDHGKVLLISFELESSKILFHFLSSLDSALPHNFKDSSLCGGGGDNNNNNNNWTAYIDEKCILVVDEVRSFKEAEEVCQKVGASVLSIDSPGEQAFLEEHLFVEKRVVNPVWLANQMRSSDDDNDDNTELLYSNWLTDRVAARRRQQQVAAKMRVGNVIKRDSASCAEMLIGGHGHGGNDHLEETAEETSTEQPTSSRSVAGAWTTVPCSKRNLIVCQKRQHLTSSSSSSWSAPEKLREELIRTRTRLLLLQRKEAAAERRTALFFASKEAEIRLRFEVLTNTTKVQLEDTVQAEVKRQLGSKYLEEQLRAAVQEAVQEKINRLAVEHKHSLSTSSSSSSLSSTHSEDSVLLAIESAIPVGFIYLQLPKSKSPKELWPTAPFIWSDVSWTYSGVFFRVLGGSSAAFGEVQDGQAPHLDEVEAKMCIHKPNGACTQLSIEEAVSLPGKEGTGGWSGYVNTAGAYLYEKEAARLDRDALRFHVTGGEVRPRNMAIRVWKRTA